MELSNRHAALIGAATAALAAAAVVGAATVEPPAAAPTGIVVEAHMEVVTAPADLAVADHMGI
ncbi:hypothetical protein ACWEQL_01010 [Kitasatospora sp. NPDC004240]